MNKIKVIVKDKSILELLEDAKKGDIIDLKDVVEIDTSYLDLLIESNKDAVYEKKLKEFKENLDIKHQSEIEKLRSEIKILEEKKNNELSLKEKEIENKYSIEINDLKNQNDNLKKSFDNQLNIKLLEQKVKYDNEISSLNIAHTDELNNLEKRKRDELDQLKDKYNEELKNKEDKINQLQRVKASLNVKQTGEDLESWCNNEMISYMQNGLSNCTWIKDNKVIKEEDESKGSKADYIFTIYSDLNHSDNSKLASVCLDMKDENPESVNKKSNSDYYAALDKNRKKKNCEYAVLVSNLEMDKANALPIFKVNEFQNMYVVRPAYMIVFLNMLTSLTTKFVTLIQANNEKALELKSKLDLIDEFNKIKNTYLDKPLDKLKNNVEEISKKADVIIKNADSINELCCSIRDSYITQIINKIDNFELNANKKVIKKLD